MAWDELQLAMLAWDKNSYVDISELHDVLESEAPTPEQIFENNERFNQLSPETQKLFRLLIEDTEEFLTPVRKQLTEKSVVVNAKALLGWPRRKVYRALLELKKAYGLGFM